MLILSLEINQSVVLQMSKLPLFGGLGRAGQKLLRLGVWHWNGQEPSFVASV